MSPLPAETPVILAECQMTVSGYHGTRGTQHVKWDKTAGGAQVPRPGA